MASPSGYCAVHRTLQKPCRKYNNIRTPKHRHSVPAPANIRSRKYPFLHGLPLAAWHRLVAAFSVRFWRRSYACVQSHHTNTILNLVPPLDTRKHNPSNGSNLAQMRRYLSVCLASNVASTFLQSNEVNRTALYCTYFCSAPKKISK